MSAAHERSQRPRVLGPLLLIGLGVLILELNLGLLTWNAWATLLQLWPVLLIGIGLEIVVGRRYAGVNWLIALATIAVLLAGIWFVPRWTGEAAVAADTITQPLGGAAQADVTIDFRAGTLKLAALSGQANLVEATLERRTGEDIRQELRMDGATAHYVLRAQQHLPWSSRPGATPTWDVRLSPQVPTQLRIATGAGQAALDLRALQLSRLDVSLGAGQTFVTLPQHGVFDAVISTGAGQAVITIPAGLAARIDVSAAIGTTQVQGSYTQDGRTYTSPGFDAAADRVTLNVRGGVGSIVIREAPLP